MCHVTAAVFTVVRVICGSPAPRGWRREERDGES